MCLSMVIAERLKQKKKDAELLQKIGQQAMEINWLKKKLNR